MVYFEVQPGIVSVVLFVLFELFGLPILDSFLRIFANVSYYRRIFSGRPVLLKDANFPGITHYLVGKRMDPFNLIATAIKILLLVVIFLIDINLTSRNAILLTPKIRMATFGLNPSDQAWRRRVVYTVLRRFEHSKECVVQNDNALTYYRIAFNLTNGVVLDSDLGQIEINVSGQYVVNDSTIICLAPGRVRESRKLAHVVGCSRGRPQGCTDSTISRRSAEIPIVQDGADIYGPSGGFNFTDYDPTAVAATWPEYHNPKLTCLTTFTSRTIQGIRKLRNCLLVVRNGTHTIAERWNVRRDEDRNEDYFVMQYPGAVFEGDLAFERYQSADLLRISGVADSMTWKSLSSLLVARSSEFVGNDTVILGRPATVTELPLWAIILGGLSIVCAVIARLFVAITERNDEKPAINTTSGLSSMLWEEHSPTSNSLKQGDAAKLGLSQSDEDVSTLRFGVVLRADQCRPEDEKIQTC